METSLDTGALAIARFSTAGSWTPATPLTPELLLTVCRLGFLISDIFHLLSVRYRTIYPVTDGTISYLEPISYSSFLIMIIPTILLSGATGITGTALASVPYFWLLSTYLVAANIVITLVLLFGARIALLKQGKPKSEVIPIISVLGTVLFAWFALVFFLAGQGVFSSAVNQQVPLIGFAIGIPIIIGSVLMTTLRSVREIIAAVPQSWLVRFQFYRVLGVVFVILYMAGRLPGIFAVPAGYGDVLVGLTALFVAAAEARHQAGRNQRVTLWNLFGLADLVIAIATGFLSAPTRFQIFSLDAPNILIGSFPLVLIPIYAVPLSVLLHIASLSKVAKAQRTGVEKMVTA
jgi:hypothetical protein